MSLFFALPLLALVCTPGCASTRPPRPAALANVKGSARASRTSSTYRKVGHRAAKYLGRKRVVVRGRRYRADCSGFVRGMYSSAGIDLFRDGPHHRGENGVSIIHRYVQNHGGLHWGQPTPGDFVFFDNSYDRNGDGRLNDRLTHVGIVERIRPGGTVVVLHFGSGKVTRSRMNLSRPNVRQDKSGEVLNDYLRRASHGPRLMGELFVAYGRL